MKTRPQPLLRILLASSLLATAFVTTALRADEDQVVRSYQFDLDDIQEIEINGSVGEMFFEPGNADEIRLVLEIKGDDGGWFRRGKDVSDLELESRTRGDRLILTQDEKHTNTTWRILMPPVASTRIHLGVGAISGEFADTELNINLGVGEVDIDLPQASTGSIDLSVGVGDADLRGGFEVEVNRAMVSQDLEGRGNGSQDLRVKVGVGDIEVRLR